MNCDKNEVRYYLDGELRPPELEALEAHLGTCAECRAYYEQERKLQQALSCAKPLYAASPELRATIQAITAASAQRRAPVALRRRVERGLDLRRRWLVAAVGLMIAMVTFWYWRAAVEPAPSEFIHMAVDAHKRRLRGQLPLEVATDSPAEVNRWFNGKVDFRLELPAYTENEDYRLEGARLVSLGREYGACVVYTADARPVTLVVVSSRVAGARGGEDIALGRLRFHCTTMDGFKVISWVDHGMTYALVSDLKGRGERSCVVCHGGAKELFQPLAPLNP